MRHIYRTTNTPNRIHVIQVDLANPMIRLRSTRYADRGRVVSSFASLYDCQVATNGDFFSYDGYVASGLAVGHGEVWPSSKDSDTRSFIAFGVDNSVEISAPNEVRQPEDWMHDVVGGRQLVVRDGDRVNFPDCTGFCGRNPRTAVGVSADGGTLYLAVVDGRSSSSVGMTLNELGALMLDLGADRAINLDGGGSSTIYIRDEGGVQNSPSDGSERVVANHLGVCVVPPFGTLRGLVRAGGIEDESAGVAGIHVSLSTGKTTTTDADGLFEIVDVPRGDVVISLDGDGYDTSEHTVYVTAADVTQGFFSVYEDENDAEEDVVPPDVTGLEGACAASSRPGTDQLALFVAALLLLSRRRRERTGSACQP